jgi:predicted nucleotide-binding protein (sugar kinase/HSP70/actin superfamily)
MPVKSKHIATFLLGAAAGLAIYKYMQMTDEEKEKLAEDIKEKANHLKADAEAGFEKLKDYFDELRTKGAEALKDNMSDAEEMLKDLFGKKEKTA